jgi:hypothetical protein
MEIIVVDDLSSALRLYDFNKNIKIAWCLNLKHIISKRKRERDREREREREREPWLGCCYKESKTYEFCFVEFVNPSVNLNHISYFF